MAAAKKAQTSKQDRSLYARNGVSETSSAGVAKQEGGEDLVNMHILTERELHRAAKLYAVTHGITLRELISDAIAKRIKYKG